MKIPGTITLSIEKKSSKKYKLFKISCLSDETCIALRTILEKIDPSVLSANNAKETGFKSIEANRRLLSKVLAIAIENSKGTFSNRVARFIRKNADAPDLLRLIYIVYKYLSDCVLYHAINEAQKEEMSLAFNNQIDKDVESLRAWIDEQQAKTEKENEELLIQLCDMRKERIKDITDTLEKTPLKNISITYESKVYSKV